MPPPKHVPDSKFVDFEANDGTVVKVSASVAKEAKTLWDFISMLDDFEAQEKPTKLENVNGDELKWVLEWCEFLKKRSAPEFKLETDVYTRQFVGFEWKPEEDHFLKEHRADMWDVLFAADYLGVPSLYYSACLFLALRMSEKDLVKEVREMFDIDMGEPKETRHSVAKRARLFNVAIAEPETSTRARRTAAENPEGPIRRSSRILSLPSKPKYTLDANASAGKIPMRRFVPDDFLYHIFRFMDRDCVKSCEWVCDRWAHLVKSNEQSLPRQAVKVAVHADGIFAKPQDPPESRLEETLAKQKNNKRKQRKVPKEKSGAKKHTTIQSLTKYGIMELNICHFGPEVCTVIEKYVGHVKDPICVQHVIASCGFEQDAENFAKQATLFRSLVESCSYVEKATMPTIWTADLVAQSPELFRFSKNPPKKFTFTASVSENAVDVTADFVRAISASGAKENTVRLSGTSFACFERLLQLFATDEALLPELRVELVFPYGQPESSQGTYKDKIMACGLRRVTSNGAASSGAINYTTEYEFKRSEHVTFRLRRSDIHGETISFLLRDKRFKRTTKP